MYTSADIYMILLKCVHGTLIGLLDPPSNVTVDFKNQTIIHLTWLPPFSLKDISGYVVTISVESNNETSDKVQTTLTEFTYSWRSNKGYCSRFVFQVAAVNSLGTSSKTSGIVAGFLRCKLIISSNRLNLGLPSRKKGIIQVCRHTCYIIYLHAWYQSIASFSIIK